MIYSKAWTIRGHSFMTSATLGGGGTLGSEVTLNSEGQLSYIDAGLCVLVPEAHTKVKAKDRIKFRSLYKKW